MLSLNLSLVYALLGILGLICLDVVFGVAVALKDGTFSLQKLPQFLATKILPYFLSLAALVAVAQLNLSAYASNLGIAADALVVIAWAALSAYALKLFQEIGQKLLTLFGINIAVTETKGFVAVRTLVILTVLMVATVIVFYLLC